MCSADAPSRNTLVVDEHGEEFLPKLISLGSDGDTIDEDDEPNREHDVCPVTGRLTNILDDYIVFPQVLGEGHYGCVRECIHRSSMQRTFACKSIDKSKVRRLDYLRNEVLLLSEMDHEGVMRMVDCYEDSDYLHIVSEKYTGGELFDIISDNATHSGCLSEHEAACITKSLLEAVAYLHENDIIHRDIKPENILFQSQEQKVLKLIDFGLSRRLSTAEDCIGNPVGTSYYMSPEVLRGEFAKSCDIWAVGTIVYILLCGYPPFNGSTDADVFQAIRRGRLQSLDAPQWRSKSDDAKKFVQCLLRRDPRKRLTAGEALAHPWIRSLGRRHQLGIPPRPDRSGGRTWTRDGATGRWRNAALEASREASARAEGVRKGRRAAARGNAWTRDGETGRWSSRVVPVG